MAHMGWAPEMLILRPWQHPKSYKDSNAARSCHSKEKFGSDPVATSQLQVLHRDFGLSLVDAGGRPFSLTRGPCAYLALLVQSCSQSTDKHCCDPHLAWFCWRNLSGTAWPFHHAPLQGPSSFSFPFSGFNL